MSIAKNEFKEWVNDLGRREKKAFTVFVRGTTKASNYLQDEAPAGATSKLKNSIPDYQETKRTSEGFEGRIGSGVQYAKIALVTGRGPGKFPPFGRGSSLDRWAKQKGIPTFLVARSIAKKGTRKYREKGPDLVAKTIARVENFILPQINKKILDIFTR